MSFYEPKSCEEREGRFSIFFKLLKVFKANILKLVWKHLPFYLISSYLLQGFYQFVLDSTGQKLAGRVTDQILITGLVEKAVLVMLSCYMAKILDRMGETGRLIRFPDELLVLVSSAIPGYTTVKRTFKSTIVRYVLASYILTLNKISYSVNKKFPDESKMVEANILTPQEYAILKSFEPKRLEYRQPLEWAGKLVTRARSDELMDSDAAEMLAKGLTTHTETMSRLLAHEQVGAPSICITAIHVLLLLCSLFSFIHHVIPKKSDLADPLNFVLNPISAALLYWFLHSCLTLADMINQPFRLKQDYLNVDRLIADNIEAATDCFSKMLAERGDNERDECQRPRGPEIMLTLRPDALEV